MDFNDIIGQKDVVSSLFNAIRHKRVGHAYIFNGPEGIGKRTMAKAFSKALLCTGNVDIGCNVCAACKLTNNQSNPDFKIIEGTNDTIGVDIIREMREDMFLIPTHSARKIYVIVNAHEMTVQAQNSLLKIFESPPSYGLVILTTSNFRELSETIRSRAVMFSFKRNTDSEVRAVLEQYSHNLIDIDFLTAYAQGIIGKALSIASSPELISKRDKLVDIISPNNSGKVEYLRDSLKFFNEDKDSINTILDIMLTFYRDVINILIPGRENSLINTDKKDIILNMATSLTLPNVINKINIIEETRSRLRYNTNYELAIEVMLLELQED